MTGPLSGSFGRIWAMMLRHLYLLRGSWPRALELIYWPTLQMITWGFMSQFMMSQRVAEAGWAGRAFGVLLGAVMLWDVCLRGQLGLLISLLEELWSRNLGQLFVTPLRPLEWAASLMAVSVLRVAIGVVPAMLLAIPLFGYSIFGMGLPLAIFFVELVVFGWGLGLAIASILLRQGLGAEGLTWAATFLLTPISAVYYPVAVLPAWLRPVALALPSTHVFEGMRSLLAGHGFDGRQALWGLVLDLVYLGLGLGLYLLGFRTARERGGLLQTGE